MIFDTIVAPITGLQPAPVAIIRLSGSEAWQIARQIFHPWPSEPETHKAMFGKFGTGDEGLALPFAKGHGYTGEQAVEFSIHGSPASVRALMEACIEKGARLAEPGEFSQRAFLNGKLDLTEAEGIRDTVDAETDAQLRQANLHRQGLLRRQIADIRNRLIALLAKVEASVDFSEEIGDLDPAEATIELSHCQQEIESLLRTLPAGNILRHGFRVAIVGPPNAGKSSLLNSLLGSERSIVTEQAGTTRDYIEEHVDLGGVHCILYDTAGLREGQSEAEAIGVQKSLAIASGADEIWYVYDASIGWQHSDHDLAASFDRSMLVLANKADLLQDDGEIITATNQDQKARFISTVSRQGYEALITHIQKKVEDADTVPFVSKRHELPLRRALDSVRACQSTLDNCLPDDLLAVGLRDAAERLGEVTGETATEDMIERIFRDFCIGK